MLENHALVSPWQQQTTVSHFPLLCLKRRNWGNEAGYRVLYLIWVCGLGPSKFVEGANLTLLMTVAANRVLCPSTEQVT